MSFKADVSLSYHLYSSLRLLGNQLYSGKSMIRSCWCIGH